MSQSEAHTETPDDAATPVEDATAPRSAEQEDGSDDDALSKDELFHLLQNRRRRDVLRYMEGRDEPVRMRDVAEQVAAWENDTTVQQITSDQRQRVYIALYQSHLETLEDAGVIDYNKPRGIVDPNPLLEEVVDYVSTEESAEDDDDEFAWERRYLGSSVAGSALLLGSLLGAPVLDVLSGFAVGVIILAMFSLLTVLRMDASADG